MENKNLIVLALLAIVLVLIGVIAAISLNTTPENETNATNDTINVTINETNETDNITTTETKKTSSPNTKKSSKSSDSDIVSESIKENYQAGDGSHYREVEYKDGNFRQYNSKGQLIGSSYDSDQAQLKKAAGDSWPGD